MKAPALLVLVLVGIFAGSALARSVEQSDVTPLYSAADAAVTEDESLVDADPRLLERFAAEVEEQTAAEAAAETGLVDSADALAPIVDNGAADIEIELSTVDHAADHAADETEAVTEAETETETETEVEGEAAAEGEAEAEAEVEGEAEAGAETAEEEVAEAPFATEEAFLERGGKGGSRGGSRGGAKGGARGRARGGAKAGGRQKGRRRGGLGKRIGRGLKKFGKKLLKGGKGLLKGAWKAIKCAIKGGCKHRKHHRGGRGGFGGFPGGMPGGMPGGFPRPGLGGQPGVPPPAPGQPGVPGGITPIPGPRPGGPDLSKLDRRYRFVCRDKDVGRRRCRPTPAAIAVGMFNRRTCTAADIGQVLCRKKKHRRGGRPGFPGAPGAPGAPAVPGQPVTDVSHETPAVPPDPKRLPEDVEDCVACRYVWLQVEMDVGNSQIEENIYDSFYQNALEAQKAPIFYPGCQTMFDSIDDMIGDYMDGYTVNQLCENSLLCR